MNTRARFAPVVASVSALLLGLGACGTAGGSPRSSSSADQPPVTTSPTFETGLPTPSPTPAGTADASSTPLPGTGEPIGPPELAAGDWVTTTVEGLRLRERPGTDGTLLGTLRIGYAGTVIDGPVAANGFEWVHVAWPGLPADSGCATGVDDQGYLNFCGAEGWLATADPLGNPWVQEADPDCPPTPTTVRELGQIPPGLQLACFGGERLSLLGFLSSDSGGRGCMPGYGLEPAWFHPCAQFFVERDEVHTDGSSGSITARIHPSLGEACGIGWQSSSSCPLLPYANGWVQVTGQYDHPAAATCVGVPIADMGQPPSDGRIVYDCRLSFVVTAIERASAP